MNYAKKPHSSDIRWSVAFVSCFLAIPSVESIVYQNSTDSSLYVSPPIAWANLNSFSGFQFASVS